MTIKSVGEYVEYENTTLLVLHDLAVQVLDLIERKGYMRTNNTINIDQRERYRAPGGELLKRGCSRLRGA